MIDKHKKIKKLCTLIRRALFLPSFDQVKKECVFIKDFLADFLADQESLFFKLLKNDSGGISWYADAVSKQLIFCIEVTEQMLHNYMKTS